MQSDKDTKVICVYIFLWEAKRYESLSFRIFESSISFHPARGIAFFLGQKVEWLLDSIIEQNFTPNVPDKKGRNAFLPAIQDLQ